MYKYFICFWNQQDENNHLKYIFKEYFFLF